MTFTEFSDKGGRSVNDDFCAHASKNGLYCFAVCDGMGGSGGAAAKIVARRIIAEFERRPRMTSDAAREYITEAHKALLEKKAVTPEYDNAASTAALLITDGASAVHATVGDTRIYMLNYGEIEEVTEDHSAAFEFFKNHNIEYEDIRTNARRHELRRAVGDRISWAPDVSGVYKLEPGCSFLICTDGFWSLIDEREIEKARARSLSSKGWMKKMLAKVLKRMKNGSDNITAAAICMQKSDAV